METVEDAASSKNTALQYPQLVMGMIAIFLYVGVEVSTAANLPASMESKLGFAIGDIAPYVSLYWASLMIGRSTGAVRSFYRSHDHSKSVAFLGSLFGFRHFLLVNAIAKHDLTPSTFTD